VSGITGTHLTRREVDVLQLVAADCSDATIARHLRISVRTVETHVSNMLGKTGAKSRAGLVAIGYSTGLLLPGTWPPAWSGTCWIPPVPRCETLTWFFPADQRNPGNHRAKIRTATDVWRPDPMGA
jgi:DNA-binding CsgD family transcriptional regulator